MSKILKVGYVTIDSPLDKRSWSGINFMIYSNLKKKLPSLEVLGPFNSYGIKQVLRVLNFLSFKFFKKKYNFGHSILLSKIYSLQLKRSIKNKDIDIIVSVTSSPALAYLKKNIKVIYITDATFQSLINYYLFNLWNFSKKESNRVESLAIKNSDKIIFASEWAENESIKNYNIPKSNSTIIPFGSNFEFSNLEYIKRDIINIKEFKLLFVGVDWKRKGGDIVLNSFLSLIEKGYKVHLTVVGCRPPIHHENIKVYPFLNKNNSEELNILKKLYLESHLFFLPSRAECAGIVFSESASFSLPVLSTNTGGISSYVLNNKNGYLLDLNSNSGEYVQLIIKIMSNPEIYHKFSQNSFNLFKSQLNWGKFCSSIEEIIESF